MKRIFFLLIFGAISSSYSQQEFKGSSKLPPINKELRSKAAIPQIPEVNLMLLMSYRKIL
jgi:hypothetical protein